MSTIQQHRNLLSTPTQTAYNPCTGFGTHENERLSTELKTTLDQFIRQAQFVVCLFGRRVFNFPRCVTHQSKNSDVAVRPVGTVINHFYHTRSSNSSQSYIMRPYQNAIHLPPIFRAKRGESKSGRGSE